MRAMMRLSDHRVLIGTMNRGRLKGGGVARLSWVEEVAVECETSQLGGDLSKNLDSHILGLLLEILVRFDNKRSDYGREQTGLIALSLKRGSLKRKLLTNTRRVSISSFISVTFSVCLRRTRSASLAHPIRSGSIWTRWTLSSDLDSSFC